MATFQELNKYYQSLHNQELQRATLSRWVKNGQVKAIKENNGKYNYDFQSFKQKVNDIECVKRVRATKEKPQDYIGKTTGQLFITGIVPKEQREDKNYKGTIMYCNCLRCGKKNIQVRFSYLTSNSNYNQETCGCGRKVRAFQATSRQDLNDDFLDSFDNFEKFLTLHKMFVRTTDIDVFNIPLQDYKNMILYFYNDKQYNAVYSYWENHKKENNTFYDWAKPSFDHIIPKSKNGTDDLENLQVLTVFENLSKRDLTMQEWNDFKIKTHTTSDYFIENIMSV